MLFPEGCGCQASAMTILEVAAEHVDDFA